jgi:hypothetical protein
VKLRIAAAFGVGYVLGTKAGRERYGQIVAAAQGASKRLEEYSGRLENASGKIDSFSGRLDAFRTRLQDFGSKP